jgi:eukaryotic-like serine/threonine-protein kinase
MSEHSESDQVSGAQASPEDSDELWSTQAATPSALNPELRQTMAADADLPDRLPDADAAGSMVGIEVNGRYTVQRLIGKGGMGAVYLAEHIQMKKLVAFKVLHGEMSDNSELVERFKREAQAAAAINHPNICEATDFGETGRGEFFLVMEFLQGRTLEHEIMQGPMSAPRVVHIAHQICGVLERAHGLGIVHRDLKPENVMLIERDWDADFVKVMDFGIASVQRAGEGEEGSVKLTRAGVAYGTPAYMSPEQVTGSPVDARSDLYSLGAVLYEALTGTVPFDGKNITKVMTQHLTEPVQQMRLRTPGVDVPAELEALVRQLLAKTPEERPESAAHVRELLEAMEQVFTEPNADAAAQSMELLADWKEQLRTNGHAAVFVPTAAQPTQQAPSETSKQRALDMRLVAVAGLMILALIGLGGIALGLVLSRPADAPASAAPAKQEQVAAKEEASLTEERDAFVSRSEMRQALEAMARGDQAQAITVLEAKAGEWEGDPHYHYYLGMAYMADKRGESALKSWGRALELDPRYASDKKLGEQVVELLDSRKDSEVKAAKELIEKRFVTHIPHRLAEAAQTHRRASVRKVATEILRDSGELAKLPKWQQVAIDLKSASGCKERSKLITELGELGDAGAMPVLQELEKLPKRGCGFLKRNDCHACIRGELRDALQKLKPAAEESASADAPAKP